MAVDLGSKRVGLALSDPTGVIASPLRVEPAEPVATLARRLAQVAREVEAAEVVVGLPRTMDGGMGPEARAAKVLAHDLRQLCGLPVALVDERLSSRAAERSLLEAGLSRARRKQLNDEVAASLILQGYLDSRGR